MAVSGDGPTSADSDGGSPSSEDHRSVRGGIPSRGTLLRVLLVVALLAGPLWVSVLHLDDPTVRYERAAVAATNGTIEYVNGSNDARGAPISDDLACSGFHIERSCYFERSLVGEGTVQTSVYTTGPDAPDGAITAPYEFVQGTEAVYRPVVVLDRSQAYVIEDGEVRPVPNASAVERPRWRVQLDLERVSPDAALDSVAVSADSTDPAVQEAARTGSATIYTVREPPATPVKLEDGSYYRVFIAEQYSPPETNRSAVVILRYLAPIAGLVLGYRILRRH